LVVFLSKSLIKAHRPSFVITITWERPLFDTSTLVSNKDLFDLKGR
jgi:hypothetical protein